MFRSVQVSECVFACECAIVCEISVPELLLWLLLTANKRYDVTVSLSVGKKAQMTCVTTTDPEAKL